MKKLLLSILLVALLSLPVFMGLVSPDNVSAVGGMTQVIFAGVSGNTSTSAVRYSSLNGGLGWSSDSTYGHQSISTAGTISSLRVYLTAAPGAGKSYTFVVTKATVAQALSVTVNDAETTDSDLVNTVAVVAGDYVGFKCTPAGTPAAAQVRWTCLFTSSTNNESLVLCSTWFYSSASTQFYPVSFAGAYSGNTTESPAWQVIPTSGTLKNLYVKLTDGNPGGGTKAFTLTLRINGDSPAGTMSVTIADVATTGSDLVNTVAVVAGDYVDFQLVCTDTPNSRIAAIGMCFVATTNGESLVLGTNRNAATVSAQLYAHAQAGKDNLAWTTTEANVNQLGQACVLRSLYVRLGATPGNFNTHATMLRKNNDVTTLTCTVTGPATTASDTTHSVTITNGDLLDFQDTVSSGTTVTVHWGMVCYVTPLTLPTVTTAAATSVEETTATLNGEITATGGENEDTRGFVYDTSTHADPGNVAPAASGYAWNWTEGGSFGAATFSHGLTSLAQGQLYYYRSCCHNSVGWDYGDTEVSFTTKPEAPTAFGATNPTTSTIDLAWTKGTGAVNTYIRGEDGSYPTDRADGYLVYDDTGVSCQDTGLTAGHHYYYRAWSWVSGTVYSDGYVQDNTTTLYPTPSTTLATPASGDRGVTGQVETIDGTGFTGVSSVSFGAGITVTSFVVDSDIQITANIDIDWDATLGLRDVSATNSGGTGTLTDGFTVDAPAPVITTVVPDSGDKGETGYDVVIAGTGFIDTSAVDFGADIIVTGFVVNSYAMITATIDIDGAATTGFRDVSVTTPGGVDTSIGGFEITEGGTLPTMLMAMVGLAGTLTFVSWRARFIVVSMAAALAWFAMGAMTLISPTTLDLGTWGTTWTIMLATAFILMTFVPLLLQMRVDIRSEAKGRDGTTTWSTSMFRPKEKITKDQAARERQGNFRNNLRTRWRR